MTAVLDYPNVVPFERRARTEDTTMEAKDEKEVSRRWFDYRRLLRRKLDPSEYVILEVLEDHASDANGGWCWASWETIKRETPVKSKTTIYATFKILEELGIIETKKEAGKTTMYRPTTREALTCPIIEHLNQFRNQTRPVQKMDKTSPKNGQVGVQKMDTNGTNLNDTKLMIPLEPNGSNAADAAPQAEKANSEEILDKPLLATLREKYELAQAGKGQTKNTSQDTAGVIGEAFQAIFKQRPKYGRLQGMAGPKQLNSGWQLIKLILSLAGEDVQDDAHDYLQKVIDGKKKGGANGHTGNNNGRANGRGTLAGNGVRTQGTGYVNAKGRQSRPGNSDVTDYSTWD